MTTMRLAFRLPSTLFTFGGLVVWLSFHAFCVIAFVGPSRKYDNAFFPPAVPRALPVLQQSSATTASKTKAPLVEEELSSFDILKLWRDEPLPMGITQELDELPKGETLVKEIQDPSSAATSTDKKTRSISMTKLSSRPPLFHLQNVLTPKECQSMIEYTRKQPMELAQTRIGGDDNQHRVGSELLWVSNNTTLPQVNLESLSQSMHALFLPFEHQPFHPTWSVEDFQVVRYDSSGEFKAHHDGALRILTILYYINGVSDTWFPLADYKGGRLKNRLEAMQVAQGFLEHGVDQHGVRVDHTVITKPGDAICFYNYFQNGDVDWNALHAGLPAESEKWIATHWYHHVPPRRFQEQQ